MDEFKELVKVLECNVENIQDDKTIEEINKKLQDIIDYSIRFTHTVGMFYLIHVVDTAYKFDVSNQDDIDDEVIFELKVLDMRRFLENISNKFEDKVRVGGTLLNQRIYFLDDKDIVKILSLEDEWKNVTQE